MTVQYSVTILHSIIQAVLVDKQPKYDITICRCHSIYWIENGNAA